MNDFAGELRTLTQILRVAFSDRLEQRIGEFVGRPATRAVLVAIATAGGEATTGELVAAAKAKGVARTTAFGAISALERAGLIDRPRHGTLALPPFVIPYIPTERGAADGEGEENATPS